MSWQNLVPCSIDFIGIGASPLNQTKNGQVKGEKELSWRELFPRLPVKNIKNAIILLTNVFRYDSILQ